MKRTIIVLLSITVLLSACQFNLSRSLPSYDRIVNSMDTVMKLTVYGTDGDDVLDIAVDEISRLNNLLDTENEESEIAKLNISGNGYLSGDTADLMSQAIQFYEITDGYFDTTVYPLSKLWGFPSRAYHVPSEKEITDTLKLIGSDKILFQMSDGKIALAQGQQVDFGGIAKGYTSQRIIDIFKENDFASGIVSLGGNVQCLGRKPDGSMWKVGIKNPQIDSSDIIAVLNVENCAVITSGGYERYFEDPDTGVIYKHILNPKTGYPVDNDLLSVTIISDDGITGDALSTALFAMGLSDAVRFWRENSNVFQAVLIDADMNLYVTEAIKDSISSDIPVSVITLMD